MKNLRPFTIIFLLLLISSCGNRDAANPLQQRKPIQVNTYDVEKCLEKGEDKSLEVVTWNIQNFPKGGQFTVDQVTKNIRQMGMDLLAIQEISHPEKFDAMLRTLKNYKGTYGNNQYIRLGFIYNTQELIPIGKPHQIYTDMGREFPRSPLVMSFKHKRSGLEFTAINIHLKCCGKPEYVERRKDAMKILKTHIDKIYAKKNVVILGDFNQHLTTDNEFKNIYYAFQVDPNFSMTTIPLMNDQDRWSYPRGKWLSQLDQIFISGALKKYQEETDSMPMDKCESDYISKVSDHRPVFTKLKVIK